VVRGIGPSKSKRFVSRESQAAEAARAQVFRLTYLLDTNVCIALINGNPVVVRQRFDEAVAQASAVQVSSIALFELWYGVSKSRRREYNARLLEGFLAGPIHLLPFEADDARVAGELRAGLESIGRPISEYDLLIAGQALQHSITLVTANVREFGRIRNLTWENWAR
jgi:tRNA(fMet)-specific endonuclease VapC